MTFYVGKRSLGDNTCNFIDPVSKYNQVPLSKTFDILNTLKGHGVVI